MRCLTVDPEHSSITMKGCPSRWSTSWTVQMCGWLSEVGQASLAIEARQGRRILGQSGGQELQGHVAAQALVPGAIDDPDTPAPSSSTMR